MAVNGQNAVVSVHPAGRLRAVVSGEDGPDSPSDVVIGAAGPTNGKLFVSDFAASGENSNPALILTHP